jgi:hypothetical protein
VQQVQAVLPPAPLSRRRACPQILLQPTTRTLQDLLVMTSSPSSVVSAATHTALLPAIIMQDYHDRRHATMDLAANSPQPYLSALQTALATMSALAHLLATTIVFVTAPRPHHPRHHQRPSSHYYTMATLARRNLRTSVLPKPLLQSVPCQPAQTRTAHSLLQPLCGQIITILTGAADAVHPQIGSQLGM